MSVMQLRGLDIHCHRREDDQESRDDEFFLPRRRLYKSSYSDITAFGCASCEQTSDTHNIGNYIYVYLSTTHKLRFYNIIRKKHELYVSGYGSGDG